MRGSFFYNFTANKENTYSKFGYGIMTIKCDDSKDLVSEAFDEVQKSAKNKYPDADSINFTAFNRVDS